MIELLIVIVVLAVLGAVVVAAVGQTTEGAEESACLADKHVLITATEAFFAQRSATTIPGDDGGEGVEQTLVSEKFMREASDYYDLDAAGALTIDTGSPCTE